MGNAATDRAWVERTTPVGWVAKGVVDALTGLSPSVLAFALGLLADGAFCFAGHRLRALEDPN